MLPNVIFMPPETTAARRVIEWRTKDESTEKVSALPPPTSKLAPLTVGVLMENSNSRQLLSRPSSRLLSHSGVDHTTCSSPLPAVAVAQPHGFPLSPINASAK